MHVGGHFSSVNRAILVYINCYIIHVIIVVLVYSKFGN